MNKNVIAKIVSLANELDLNGNHTEADALTKVAKRLSRTTVAFYPEHEPDPEEHECPECGDMMSWDDMKNEWYCEACDYGMEDSEDETAEDYYGYDPDSEPDY